MTGVELDAATFCRRILRRMSAFKTADSTVLSGSLTYVIPDDETVLGIYENNTGSLKDAVVVTNVSLWVFSEAKAEESRYDEFTSATWWPDDKRQADSVRICLKNGKTIFVPVRGEQGGGRDVFEFLRFVSRVIGALSKTDD